MSGPAPDRTGAAGGPEGTPGEDGDTDRAGPPETEPDARFTFANERTFLAWNRTALALVVAGLGIGQLLPPFPGLPWARYLLAVALIVFGAVLSVGSFVEWGRNQRALRRAEPLPSSPLPRLLAVIVVGLGVTAAALLLLSTAIS